VTEPAMIISMPTLARSQQRYDHRLRNLVQRTGDVTVATHLGVPRSTARGWLIERPTVVCLDVTELAEPELRQEVLKLRRRVRSSRPCCDWRWPCCKHPGFASPYLVCRTDATSGESCALWIEPGSTSRCERFCGFCVSRRVGFMPGVGGSARVCSRISLPVRAYPRLG